MTDCTKTLDFFAAWKRMCEAHKSQGACRQCPVSPEQTEAPRLCFRYCIEQPADAVKIVQEWADAHHAPTWEDKLRELLPSVDMEQVVSALCPGEFFGGSGPSRLHCTTKDADCRVCWQREYVEGE